MIYWDTENNGWWYVCVLLTAILLWLWRNLRDATQRKNHLADIAQKLSEQVRQLKNP